LAHQADDSAAQLREQVLLQVEEKNRVEIERMGKP
jgi:hypothetical protein